MKKAVLLFAVMVFAVLSFSAGAVSAQEKQVFLSLTKSDIDIDELPTNVTIISQKEITDAHVQTLGELLSGETDIVLKSQGAAGSVQSVFIRGGSSAQTLVLIDGRKVNTANLGIADFSNIPTQNIERIEIIRGAGAAIYGAGAFGGVINVITKKAENNSPALDGNISYGSFNTLNPWAVGAYKNQNFGTLLSLSYYSSDGERDNSDFKNVNGFFSGQAYLTENSNLSLTGQVYDSETGVPGSVSMPSGNARQKDNNNYAKLDYNLALDKNSLAISVYAVDNKEYYSSLYADNKYSAKTYGAQAEFHLSDFLLLGIESSNENFKNDDLMTADYSFEHSRENFAGYVQADLDFWKFKILPSVRVDKNSQFGTQITPSLSAIFNAAQEIKFSANAGKVFRAPTFNELYTNQDWGWGMGYYGDPNLKPEKGLSYDFGADYTGEKFKFNITGFYIESEDLIVDTWDDTGLIMSPKNINKVQSYGAEISAGQIITSWLEHRVNYAYLQAKNKSEGANNGKYIVYKPQDTVRYSLILRPIKNLTISAIVSFIGERYDDEANSEVKKLDAYSTLDININYKVNENFSLWVKAFNIADAEYESTLDYPMPGAAFYGGVNIKLFR